MRELWKELVAENPMLGPSVRSQYRAFLPKRGAPAAASWILGGVVYLGVVALAAVYAEYLLGDWFLFPTCAVMILVALNILHGVVAGEREKRSLDTLLAAPLTSGQILFAKAARVGLALAMCLAGLVGPYLAIEIARPLSGMTFITRERPAWFVLPAGVAVCVGASLAAAGISIFVSSRAKTTAAALVGSLFAILTWLLGVPLVAQAFTGLTGGNPVMDMTGATNPFVLLAEAAGRPDLDLSYIRGRVILFAAGSTVAAVGLFSLAVRGLRETRSGRRIKVA